MTLHQETDLILCGFSPQPPELSLNHRSSVWCYRQQFWNTWRSGKGFPHLLGPPDSGGQKWFTNRMIATIYAQWRSALPVGWVVCGLEAPSFLAYLRNAQCIPSIVLEWLHVRPQTPIENPWSVANGGHAPSSSSSYPSRRGIPSPVPSFTTSEEMIYVGQESEQYMNQTDSMY